MQVHVWIMQTQWAWSCAHYQRGFGTIWCHSCHLILSSSHLFAIPSDELNSTSIPLLLSLVFLFRYSLYKYEFYEICYCMEKLKCDDIHCKKVLLDSQSTGHSPTFNNYIQPTSLHVLYSIYESQERSEQSFQYSMIFEEGTAKPLEFQSSLTKRILFASHHGKFWTLHDMSFGIHDQTLNSAVQQIEKR
jgi:hypothetical protein